MFKKQKILNSWTGKLKADKKEKVFEILKVESGIDIRESVKMRAKAGSDELMDSESLAEKVKKKLFIF